MPNTYLQKSLERQIFRTGRFAKRHQKNWQLSRINLALPRAISSPMRLANTVTRKAGLCIGPIAVQRRYFPPDARALNMLFQAAHKFIVNAFRYKSGGAAGLDLKSFQNGGFFKKFNFLPG